MITHPGFDIFGAVPIPDGLEEEAVRKRTKAAERGDWSAMALDDIAISWDFSDEVRESEITVEGVTLRFDAGGVANPTPHVLSDLLYIIEERDVALEEGGPGAAKVLFTSTNHCSVARKMTGLLPRQSWG